MNPAVRVTTFPLGEEHVIVLLWRNSAEKDLEAYDKALVDLRLWFLERGVEADHFSDVRRRVKISEALLFELRLTWG